VLNANQISGLPSNFLGVDVTDGVAVETDRAKCLSPNEPEQDLSGQMFFYRPTSLKGAEMLMSVDGKPLVTVNRVGRGKVVFVAVPDYLGEDDRLTPFVAHLLVHLAAEATPVRVKGDVEYLVNQNSTGWLVTLFNDSGVFKPQQGLAQVDRSATVEVKLSLRDSPIKSASEWTSDQTLSVQKEDGGDAVTLKIPAGGIAVVQLVTAR
jgi:hypothetical protein